MYVADCGLSGHEAHPMQSSHGDKGQPGSIVYNHLKVLLVFSQLSEVATIICAVFQMLLVVVVGDNSAP